MKLGVEPGKDLGDVEGAAASAVGARVRPRSLFPEDDGDRRSWRVRPAELARLIGVSPQSISRAIQDGKILLGPDGKVNPDQATSQYLRNTNPNKLRARVLAPLVRDLQAAQARETEMQAELERLRAEIAECEESIAFEEAAASELCAIGQALALAVVDLWHELDELDPEVRADFLGNLPDRLSEQWHLLEGMDPKGRAAELAAQLTRREDSPAEAKDFLDSIGPTSAAFASAKGEWRKGQPTNEDEDHDDRP